MVDEINTGTENEEALPGVAEDASDNPADGVSEGEGAAPKTPQQVAFDKIDPTKLSPADLKIYKHYQGLYTKARQKDKLELAEYNKKLSEIDRYSNDPDHKALQYFKQNGKFPEGYVPTYRTPEKEQSEPVDDPDKFLDPEVIALKEKMSEYDRKEFEREKAAGLNDIKSFIKDLKDIDPTYEQLYYDKAEEMKVLIDSWRGNGMSNQDKIKKAWYALTGETMFENGKKSAWEQMKKKKEEPKPELQSTGASVKEVNGSTLEAAFDAAVAAEGGL